MKPYYLFYLSAFLILKSINFSASQEANVPNVPVPQQKQKNVPEQEQSPIKTPPKSKPNLSYRLFHAEECQEDIKQYCPRAQKVEMSDIIVLQCIHNNVKTLSSLNPLCQHLLYTAKKNMTINLNKNPLVTQICGDDIKKIPECSEDDGKHLSTCLLSNHANITNIECSRFIRNMAPMLFTDYRLVQNFHEDCAMAIDRFECGRLEREDPKQPTLQGQTIHCLQDNYRKFKDDLLCQKQIIRISELQSSDFHLDRILYFACREDRERFCPDIVSGHGQVYKCLKMNKFNQAMSEECRAQLTKRQNIISDNIKADKIFYTVCKSDIVKNKCFDQKEKTVDQMSLSIALLCLENAKKEGIKINNICQAEMIDHRKMLMDDYKLSPNIVKYCESEITKYCNGGIERNGKTLHCLFNVARKFMREIRPECFVELKTFMKIVNPAENIKIDTGLYNACQNLLEEGPCKNLRPGHGRVVECLTRQIDKPNMNEDCQERLLEIQFFVVRDWTLNAEFYQNCKNDAVKFCNAPTAWFDNSNDVKERIYVLPCLYHHMPDIDETEDKDKFISKNCAINVREAMLKRAKKVELMPQIQDACGYYLSKFCSASSTSKKGEELRCLQSHFKELEGDCLDEIRSLSKNQNQDIRLDQVLYNSCLPTIEKFCADKRDEKSALLECLILNKNHPSMQYKCLVGIEHHQLLNLQDVSLNVKFMKQCADEINQYCSSMKSKLDTVYCLSEMVLNDTLLNKPQRVKPMCKDQLRFELFQTNENIKLDPALENVCKEDIAMFCQDVRSGKGQIVECLRSNQQKISAPCRIKLSNRNKIESIDEKTDYALQTHCKAEIHQFCHLDSSVTIVDCLRKHLLEHSFEQRCRRIVINRIITQNKDVRLNPNLYRSCRRDITRLCYRTVITSDNSKTEKGGSILKCLKENYVKNMLSKTCLVEVGEIMREAANVDFRLDPSLTENCLPELEQFCSQESNDEKENCLRLSFQQMKISKDSHCYNEVKRIIIEGAADVFVDHDLSELCESDLSKFCGDVPPGNAQHLKCLMKAKESRANRFSPHCAEALNSRRQLWKMAKVEDEINGINDLAYLINISHRRSYLFSSLMLLVFVVFLAGFFCRPIIFRSRQDKIK